MSRPRTTQIRVNLSEDGRELVVMILFEQMRKE